MRPTHFLNIHRQRKRWVTNEAPDTNIDIDMSANYLPILANMYAE